VTLTPTLPKSCISIDIVDDRSVEGTEKLTVSLTLAGQQNGAVLIFHDTATVFIIDNDEVILTVASDTVREGDKAMITLHRAATFGDSERFVLKTKVATAIASDFSGLSFSIDLTTEKMQSINIERDELWEWNEYFTVTVEVPGQNRKLRRTIFIKNINELQVGFNATNYVVSENEGSVTVCVTQQEGSIGDGSYLCLGIRTQQMNDSAQEILDYRGISAVANLSASVSGECFTLAIVDDNVTEDNEFFTVSLSLLQKTQNVIFTQQNVIIKIEDDDVAEIGFVQSVYTTREDLMSVTVCIEVKKGLLSIPVNISVSTYSPSSGQGGHTNVGSTVILTMIGHESCTSIPFQNDLVVEETEILSVSLSVSGDQRSAVNLSQDTATIFITNDDVLNVGFTADSYTVHEADGSVQVCVQILSGELGADITLQLDTHSGTAEDETDYMGLQETNITLTSNLFESCVRVLVEDDFVYEQNEFLTVSLSKSGELKSAVNLSKDTATVFIADDDNIDVGFEHSVYTISEFNESVTVCLRVREGLLQIPLNLTISSASLSAEVNSDFTAPEDRVIRLRPPYEGPSCATAIYILDDRALETSENLTVSLSTTEGLQGVNLFQYTATIVILDNDKVRVGLENSSYTVREDAGSLNVCVVVLDNGALGTILPLHVDSKGGTAEGMCIYYFQLSYMTNFHVLCSSL
jgi:hypothetical protein